MSKSLKRVVAVPLAVLIVAGGIGLWTCHGMWASEAPTVGAGEQFVQAKGEAAAIKRGDYLVNEVARCGDCHTPRDDNGRLDMTRHLQGAKMWFTPKIKPKGEWEDKAPDITASGKAGKWSEAKMVKFLSTGGRSDAPMPAYRLSMEDAQAVTAYLRSLPGRKKEAN